MRKRTYMTAFILLVIILVVGCSNSEYTDFSVDFNDMYYKVAKDIDITNTYDSLKRLQSEENIQRINKMGTLIENIKDKVPSNKKKLYEELKQQYDGLIFLKESFSRIESLTKDEKRRINTEIWWAYHLYEDRSKGK